MNEEYMAKRYGSDNGTRRRSTRVALRGLLHGARSIRAAQRGMLHVGSQIFLILTFAQYGWFYGGVQRYKV